MDMVANTNNLEKVLMNGDGTVASQRVWEESLGGLGVRTLGNAPQTQNKDEICPICLEAWTDTSDIVYPTECNNPYHAFHRPCLRKWVEYSKATRSAVSCPKCQKPLILNTLARSTNASFGLLSGWVRRTAWILGHHLKAHIIRLQQDPPSYIQLFYQIFHAIQPEIQGYCRRVPICEASWELLFGLTFARYRFPTRENIAWRMIGNGEWLDFKAILRGHINRVNLEEVTDTNRNERILVDYILGR